jgi:hypothetical protein
MEMLYAISKNITEHLEHIKKVFKRLKAVGFHLKLRKCAFCIEQIKRIPKWYGLKNAKMKSKRNLYQTI